jgi:hypothetical protein
MRDFINWAIPCIAIVLGVIAGVLLVLLAFIIRYAIPAIIIVYTLRYLGVI